MVELLCGLKSYTILSITYIHTYMRTHQSVLKSWNTPDFDEVPHDVWVESFKHLTTRVTQSYLPFASSTTVASTNCLLHPREYHVPRVFCVNNVDTRLLGQSTYIMLN